VFLPPISLERILQVERLFLCIGIIRFDLAMHMIFFPYCIYFYFFKKGLGKICRIFFPVYAKVG
jgi:hypothetical protein